ncbi:hypothetical protein [Pantoea sp. A4]|uniref:hypothetical protein n=1 Tax=Pantoea sp. A4 TaxID=1225184 RepID=UPI0012ED11CA|nr:hypothetical protein [Pantoea sp. A4]
MKQDRNKQQDAGKLLRNTIRMRRWSIIGGTAVGLQALLSVLTRPDDSGTVLFQAILAIGCIGYGLSLTPRIRSLDQASEVEK